MEIEFWAARWKEGKIGFHEGRANTFLEKHEGRLGAKGRVLVPLCGKTEDLMFLASHGHDVVGIEAVEDAARAFFIEHGMTPEVRVQGVGDGGATVRTYEAKVGATGTTITIHAGDFFACTKDVVGLVTAFYDRAALVALPADMRDRYVAHLRALCSTSTTTPTPGLVITFDYPQAQMEGPPFAVGETDVRRLFEAARSVEQIDNAPAQTPRFREAGLLAVERCFSVVL